MTDPRLEKFADRIETGSGTPRTNEARPSELFREVEAKVPAHSSKDAALKSYQTELEVLAAKYGTNIEDLLEKAHSSVGKYDPDFERAISLSKRIHFLKNV
ncbi:MAG: hypothetical protein P4M08_15325 [Oligoflexia bacterium]|nr:hypothetical protein [Oligoflexia bacterium]